MNNNTAISNLKLERNRHRILLVDDEPAILKSLRRLLRSEDFEILVANGAAEALQILAEVDVQVMLTDYKMPDMNGAELIQVVRQEYPHIISLILSGQADLDQVIRLLNSRSAMRFIQKPWSNKEIVRIIDQAFKVYEKSYEGSWLQRVNRLASKIESTDFEEIVYRYKQRKQEHFVVALQFGNIAELAKSVGQENCEQLQAELVEHIANLLPPLSEFIFQEPGLLLITIGELQSDSVLETLLNDMMLATIEHASTLQTSIRLELKASYQYISDFTLEAELLVEQLKATIQSTNALRPVVHLNDELTKELSRQQQIKASITPELANGKFSLVIQPKVSLPNKLVESGEILLRWQHSTLGWISPTEFIRLAELDGQINQMGNWVLDHGIQLISRLKRFSPDIKSVSINVSARQLYHVGFVEHLKSLLDKYKLDGKFLELEVTETCIAEDPVHIQEVLWKLKLLDVLISVDDFGAGGTAYSFLTNLPIDILKLDKCLIDDIAVCENKCKLVKSLIEICHSLNIVVVGEGVEDIKTAAILERLGCDRVQGFIYSKAVKQKEFEKILVTQPYTKSMTLLSQGVSHAPDQP
jgi:EAL domain-containing protein (putative c-di-GMP-specific phosphodiesterase class I)/DNA-binding response OmpR family regulator